MSEKILRTKLLSGVVDSTLPKQTIEYRFVKGKRVDPQEQGKKVAENWFLIFNSNICKEKGR